MKKYLLALVGILLINGCRTIVYESIKDGKKITYTNMGFNTKIGGMTIVTPEGGHLELKDTASEASQALELANKVIDRIPK